MSTARRHTGKDKDKGDGQQQPALMHDKYVHARTHTPPFLLSFHPLNPSIPPYTG